MARTNLDVWPLRWGNPELAVERALREVDTGLTALKGDPFGHQGLFITPEAERDAIAKVKAVREAVGDDVELLVEVHGRLAPAAGNPHRQCPGGVPPIRL